MAKNLNYTRKIVENLSIKGVFNEDATSIIYTDEDKNEVEVTVEQLLGRFAAQSINLTVKIQAEEELELDPEDEYVPDDAVTSTDVEEETMASDDDEF